MKAVTFDQIRETKEEADKESESDDEKEECKIVEITEEE